VTRSVANHLNDISKIDPLFVLNKLRTWAQSNKQDRKEMGYIIQHSLRTLVKKGHPQTLLFLGFKPNPRINIIDFTLSSNQIHKGDVQEFELVFDAHETTNILIDFIVTYPTKHKRTTNKVYKLMTIKAEQGKRYPIKGRRKFDDMSTRKIYPGTHKIEIQINGKIVVSEEFDVLDE
jgi:3-methyladenine DNA glycosylase AlkC